MAIRDEKRTTSRRLVSGGLLVYQQVAAIVAAFALIAFFSHFFDFEWRGFVANLVGQWNEYVRPAMKWLLYYAVTVPFGWLRLRVEVPLPLRDYLAVGLALALSLMRVVHRNAVNPKISPWEMEIWRPWQSMDWLNALLLSIRWPPLVLLVWPATVVSHGSSTCNERHLVP